MALTPYAKTGRLTRRAVVAGLVMSLPAAALAGDPHPALIFMQKVAKDMLNAHRQGTIASFKRAILRHADVPGIADYSLGQYREKLNPAQKPLYDEGVATFMSRYFADQSRQYPVAKYEIGEAAAADNNEVNVDTKVFLMSGETYTVVWRLGWKGGAYKVIDAKVLGFSLVYLQRGIFTSYLAKRNGDVGQLVTALNR